MRSHLKIMLLLLYLNKELNSFHQSLSGSLQEWLIESIPFGWSWHQRYLDLSTKTQATQDWVESMPNLGAPGIWTTIPHPKFTDWAQGLRPFRRRHVLAQKSIPRKAECNRRSKNRSGCADWEKRGVRFRTWTGWVRLESGGVETLEANLIGGGVSPLRAAAQRERYCWQRIGGERWKQQPTSRLAGRWDWVIERTRSRRARWRACRNRHVHYPKRIWRISFFFLLVEHFLWIIIDH